MIYQRYPNYTQALEQSRVICPYYDKCRILVIRNFTLEMIFDPYLNYFLHFSHIHADVEYIQFGDITDIFDFMNYDYVLIWIKIDNIINNFKINEYEEGQHIKSVVDKINYIIKTCDKNIIVMGFDPICYSSVSNVDVLDKDSLYNSFNDITRIFDSQNVHYLDVRQLYSRYGIEKMSSSINSQRWDMPYSKFAFCEYANLIVSFIVGHRNKTKKCLVLDCDNVLWGGVAEEVGIQNVLLSDSTKGYFYKQFQKCVLNLYSRGIILALCSKNNEQTVYNVLKNHPDMLLSVDHFSNLKVNWNDKVKNLREIASELNMSLSSFVFIDDSYFEINWVENQLPEVTLVKFTADEPDKMVRLIQTITLFSSLYLTKEDTERNKIYQIKAQEKTILDNSASYDDFMNSLEINSEIREAGIFDIDRIAQLMQRTNQFNINRIRYTVKDIEGFLNDKSYCTYIVTYRDKFFDYGIVGAFILKEENKCYNLVTFYLSCKVLKRNLESDMLKRCIELSEQKGYEFIRAHHIISSENHLASEYFRLSGFRRENDQNIYSLNIEEDYVEN